VIGGEDGRVAWRTGWDGWESSRVDRVVREFRMRDRNGVDRLLRETRGGVVKTGLVITR